MKHSSQRGYFITLEGIEGAGKSTALQFIRQLLLKDEIPLVVTREPGGTPIADQIRQILLEQHAEKMSVDTELLLMFASRAQNLANVIKPALEKGNWVLCDRFTDASYAYQGGGRKISATRIVQLEQWVHGDLQPDITLLFDLPVEVGLSRIQKRKTKDRIEREEVEFFEAVRETYLKRAQQYPKRFRIIDASGDFSEVEKQIIDALAPLMFKNEL